MLKKMILASTAVLSLSVPVRAQDAAAAPAADTVVATVNGAEITLGQMIIAYSQLPQQYQQLPAEILFQGVMDQLIRQQLLAETVETVPARVEIALVNQRRSLLAGEVVNRLVQGAVTEAALQAAYAAMFADAPPQKEYNAAHILVATEEEANAVKARIEAGEDFAAVAQEVSTDTGSGAAGGELGWFTQGMMVEPFEAAVMAMEPGTLAGPVQTQFGWHIIRLNEVRDKVPPTFDEVRGALEEQVQQAAVEARLTELEAAATIVRPAEGAFDPAVVKNLALLGD